MAILNNPSYRYVSLIVLLATLVFLFLLYLENSQPDYFLFNDNATYFLPSYSYSSRAMFDHKTIPLVNFHQYLGQSFLAQGQTGVLYLPVYISVFLSKITTGNIFNTIDILAFIHLIASSIGMFLLLRRFQLSTAICFLTSLMWITMPFIITVSRNWIFISYAAAYLPLNFLLLDKLASEPKIKNSFYLSLLKSAFLYQGYIQYVFITVVFEVVYLILLLMYRVFSNLGVRVGQFRSQINVILNDNKECLKIFFRVYLYSLFFLFCLTAPLLFPMFFQQKDSAFRSTSLPFEIFIRRSIAWRDFITSQFFYLRENVVYDANSGIFYFGFFNLALLSLALVKKLSLNYKISVCILISGLALLFSTHLYSIFYYIPGFNLFRHPFKYFLFFLFFATIGVAGVMNSIIQKNAKWVVKVGMYLLLSVAIGLNCLIILRNPENLFGMATIDKPSMSYLEKKVSKKAGRIFTFWLKGIDPRELYKYFTFSFATLFDYFHFAGYDPLVSKLNYRLCLRLGFKSIYNRPFSQPLLNYLSSWSARYFITSDNFQNRFHLSYFPQLKLIYEENDILLYENTRSFPLVYYYDDKVEKLDFDFGINEVNVYPNNRSARTIVINVAPLPQFQIYINGIYTGKINPGEFPVKINIPPNTSQVTLKYVDYPFYAGIVVFIIFGIGLVIFLVISAAKKRTS